MWSTFVARKKANSERLGVDAAALKEPVQVRLKYWADQSRGRKRAAYPGH